MSAEERRAVAEDSNRLQGRPMSDPAVKQAVDGEEERTVPGRFYRPATDIFESDEALTVVMDMPGVARDRVEIKLERDVLSVQGYVDSDAYRELAPVYAEYNLGHFSRSFVLSAEIDQEGISANMSDGVLSLRLPKLKERQPRRVAVS